MTGQTSMRLLVILVALAGATEMVGCTLVAAAGSTTGGRVLIAKTRDRRTRFAQVIREVRPGPGFKYLGIAGDESDQITSGVNERGLAVVTAKVSTRPERGMIEIGALLANAHSIDTALAWLSTRRRRSTWFLMLADPDEIALMESAPGRPIFVRRTANGILTHTNHYVSPDLTGLNTRAPGTSSIARLARMNDLMALLARKRPITVDGLMAACRDHGTAPTDASVCRHPELVGKNGGTLSAAVYQLERGKSPRILVCLGQPCVSRFVELSFDRPIPPTMVTPEAWQLNEARRSVVYPPPPVKKRTDEED